MTPYIIGKTNLISQVAFHNELKNCKYLEKYLHVTTQKFMGQQIMDGLKRTLISTLVLPTP